MAKAKKNIKKENYLKSEDDKAGKGLSFQENHHFSIQVLLYFSFKLLDRVWKRDEIRSKLKNKGKEGFLVEDKKASKYFYEIPRMYQNMCLLVSVLLAIAFHTQKSRVCYIILDIFIQLIMIYHFSGIL